VIVGSDPADASALGGGVAGADGSADGEGLPESPGVTMSRAW